MKYPFKAKTIILICIVVVACGQASQIAPTSSATSLPTDTVIPTQAQTSTTAPTTTPIATSTIKVTPKPTYVPPTLIPTIDPKLLPKLLRNALSIQKLDLNGYKTLRITGWNYGFGGRYSFIGDCPGFYWLDSSHLILYPQAGQDIDGFSGTFEYLTPQPIVINLETGKSWLPSPDKPRSAFDCKQLNWSKELSLLITTENQGDNSAVFTYTYEGQKLASFPGKLASISPSKTKIFMEDGTVINLQTNKQTKLNWDLENYDPPVPSRIYWTSDEMRIYQCCYFYADLANGTSYRYTESDFLDGHGSPLNYEGLWMYRGQWVLDDTYFLVQWSWVDDGDIRYIPMFNPDKKMLYDVRKKAGISPDLTCPQTDVSPDGKYLWIMCYETDYLVNLSNFETTTYPGHSQVDMDWSEDSQFAWLNNIGVNNDDRMEILSISNKKLSLLPITPMPESEHSWHPSHNVLVYPAKDKNVLIFLDASTMIYRELPFKDQTSQHKITSLVWSPNGDKLVFITDDHILWQVDYPSLENLEQIIASANTIGGAQWSPNGKAISFLNGSDIYIVDISQ